MKLQLEWKETLSAAKAKLWTEQYRGINERIGFPGFFLYVIEDGVLTAHISQDTDRAYEKYAEKEFSSSGFREKYIHESISARKRMQELFERAKCTEWDRLDNGGIASLLEEYKSAYLPITICFTLTNPQFTRKIHEKLGEELSNIGDASAMQTLLAPEGHDVLKREELALRKMALHGFDGKKIEAHATEYALMFYNSYDSQANLAFIEGRVKEFALHGKEQTRQEIERIENDAARISLKQKEMLERLPADAQRHAMLLRDLGADRLELKNTWAGAEYRFLPLFEETAKRIGVPFEEMMGCYSLEDMQDGLRGRKTALEDIKSRRKFYIYYEEGYEVKIAEGEQAKEMAMQWAPDYFDKYEGTALVGTTACKGVAKGKARVVFNAGIRELNKDVAEFQEGEILVTPMTQPNMVVLAKRAAAIVTDEGGITSHAAVISRELGIPCVVGTRKATKAIKTGDEIEVDARKHEGNVRIISTTW